MAKLVNVVKPMVLENHETGKKITVEYNRNTIKRMDQEGVLSAAFIQRMQDSPLTTASELFYYGLLMHQPDMTREEADALLYDEIGLDEKIMERLGELFNAPYESMMSVRKNSAWTVK